MRSDERRVATGLESLYAMQASESDASPGPASRPARNSLLQIPAYLGRRGAGAEGMGLYDTGASVSFIDAAFAKRHGLTVHSAAHHLRVMNGDGSFQSAQGEVRVFLNIGASFSEKITFVVINLDQFDFIIGLPDINGFRMELRGDPMRIHILGTKKKIVAPTVIGSWEDESGQRHVQVLDFSAAEIKGWQAAGRTEAYHLFEDPHAEMIAAGAWDPGEEIEWRAYFMGRPRRSSPRGGGGGTTQACSKGHERGQGWGEQGRGLFAGAVGPRAQAPLGLLRQLTCQAASSLARWHRVRPFAAAAWSGAAQQKAVSHPGRAAATAAEDDRGASETWSHRGTDRVPLQLAHLVRAQAE